MRHESSWSAGALRRLFMADWSPDNPSCLSTWMALRVLEQSRLVFAKSGAVPMRELAYWSTVPSQAMRTLEAHGLAKEMDNILRLIDGAGLEEGATIATAVDFITAILTDGDRTVAELAEVIDQLYHFPA
jgi:hypothetical protein